MGTVTLPSFGSDPATVNAANLDGKVDPLANEFNGNIENVNIKSSAAIVASKLDLSTVAQNIAHSGTMTHSGIVTMSSKILKLAKGADVASANALTLGTDGNYFDITGTTAITSIGTLGVGTVVRLHFDGALTLTHNATDLILPGGANITTAAGDEAEFVEYASGDWRCLFYSKAAGTPIVSDAPSAASQAEMEAASSTSVYASPGRVQYHPGVAKAWVNFNGSGTPAVTASHNFDSSITDNGTGLWTLTITTDMSSANWCAVGMTMDTGSDNESFVCLQETTPMAAGTIKLNVSNFAGTAQDATIVCVACFGDQ